MPEGGFDAIICSEGFQHDAQYAKTLARMVDLLKPGGLFIFTCASRGRHADHGAAGSADVATTTGEEEEDNEQEEEENYYRGLDSSDLLNVRMRSGTVMQGFRPFFRMYHNQKTKDLYFVGISNGGGETRPPPGGHFPLYEAPGVYVTAAGSPSFHVCCSPSTGTPLPDYSRSAEEVEREALLTRAVHGLLDVRLEQLQDRVAALEAEMERRLDHLSACMEDVAWRTEMRVDKLEDKVLKRTT